MMPRQNELFYKSDQPCVHWSYIGTPNLPSGRFAGGGQPCWLKVHQSSSWGLDKLEAI